MERILGAVILMCLTLASACASTQLTPKQRAASKFSDAKKLCCSLLAAYQPRWYQEAHDQALMLNGFSLKQRDYVMDKWGLKRGWRKHPAQLGWEPTATSARVELKDAYDSQCAQNPVLRRIALEDEKSLPYTREGEEAMVKIKETLCPAIYHVYDETRSFEDEVTGPLVPPHLVYTYKLVCMPRIL